MKETTLNIKVSKDFQEEVNVFCKKNSINRSEWIRGLIKEAMKSHNINENAFDRLMRRVDNG